MFRPIAPPSKSSGIQLDSESRQKEALKMANYWLQFAENQTAMAQQAMEHAQMFFAEASQCLEGPSGDCAPKDMAVDPGLENDSEKLAPSSIKGPNGEPLAFSAKGMAAINKLMGVPSVVPSKSTAAPQAPSSRPVTPKNNSATISFREPLLYPSQLDSPIDLTRVRDSGIGIFDAPSPVNKSSSTYHHHKLPFRLRRIRDPFTYPSSNPFSLALRSHATAAENMRADLEEIQEQIDEIIEGHGRAVDTDILRRLDFDRRGSFVPAVEKRRWGWKRRYGRIRMWRV